MTLMYPRHREHRESEEKSYLRVSCLRQVGRRPAPSYTRNEGFSENRRIKRTAGANGFGYFPRKESNPGAQGAEHPASSPKKDAGIPKHPHPRTVLTPLLRMPGIRHRSEDAFRVRHHDGEVAVRCRQSGNTQR